MRSHMSWHLERTLLRAVVVAAIVWGIVSGPRIRAQSAPPVTPKFEVASIRPCKADIGPASRGSGLGNSSLG